LSNLENEPLGDESESISNAVTEVYQSKSWSKWILGIVAAVAIGGLVLGLAACSVAEVGSGTTVTADGQADEATVISEEAFTASVSALDSQYEEFDELTDFYTVLDPKKSVQFIISTTYYDTGIVEPKIAIFYEDEDWIFFESLDIRTNGETVNLFSGIPSYDKLTDVDDGVLELYVYTPLDSQVPLLMGLVDDSQAKFRLLGSSGSVERNFTLKEKQAFVDAFTIYLGIQQGLVP